jgi:hypothetical protein
MMGLRELPYFSENTNRKYSNSCNGLDRPWGFQKNETSRFHGNGYMKVVRLSALRTGRLYPRRKYSWSSFLLEAESTPGPQCGRKDHVFQKLQWHHRTHNLPTCSAVLQKIAPPRTLFWYTLTLNLLKTEKSESIFISNAPRLPTDHCFLEGSQALSVCPAYDSDV